MEDPVTEISSVIHSLTQSAPSVQRATLQRYFTPRASFTHPFCRTGSYDLSSTYGPHSLVGSLLREDGPLPAISSRALTGAIYRWYKVLSPRIELAVHSVAFDSKNLRLYVGLSQVFRIPYVPFYSAPVDLVTVLRLERDPASAKTTYLISSQDDRYAVEEWIKFVSPFRILWVFVMLWQFVASGVCLLAQALASPVIWVEERYGQGSVIQGGKGENDMKTGWGQDRVREVD